MKCDMEEQLIAKLEDDEVQLNAFLEENEDKINVISSSEMIIVPSGTIDYEKLVNQPTLNGMKIYGDHNQDYYGIKSVYSDDGVEVSVGGVKTGQTFTNKTVQEVLHMLFHPNIEPTVKVTISRNEYHEIGSSVQNPTILIEIDKGNAIIGDIKLFDDNGLIFVFSYEKSIQYSVPATITSDTTYRVETEYKFDESEKWIKKNTYTDIKFVPASYCGLSETKNVTAEIVESLDKKFVGSRQYTLTGIPPTGGYVVYAYKKNYGDLTSILDLNEFELIGIFRKLTLQINGEDYICYIQEGDLPSGKLIFS